MEKYYKLDTKKVINTVTIIPQKQWSKKKVLPYELNKVDLPEGEPTDIVEGFDIQKDKVIETKINRYKVLTLEEYKKQKYEEVKNDGSLYIKSIFSLEQQTSAGFTLAGVKQLYTNEEAQIIVDFVEVNFNKIRSLGISIRDASTKAEVDTFVWVD